MSDDHSRSVGGFEVPAGPAAMGQTSLGMVFLYEAGNDDIARYGQLRLRSAMERIRWLLERIASRSSSGASGKPPMLTPAEASALTAAEIESLFETFLGSPGNQRLSLQAAAAQPALVRAPGESIVNYFDRLIEWCASHGASALEVAAEMRPAPEAAAAIAPHPRPVAENADLPRLAAGIHASQRAIQASLVWAAGAVILALIALGGSAAWIAHQSYMRGLEVERKNDAWQQKMKMLAENNSSIERGFTELATENARLKARIELLERRPKAAAKASSPPLPRSAQSKTPSKASRQSAKK